MSDIESDDEIDNIFGQKYLNRFEKTTKFNFTKTSMLDLFEKSHYPWDDSTFVDDKKHWQSQIEETNFTVKSFKKGSFLSKKEVLFWSRALFPLQKCSSE